MDRRRMVTGSGLPGGEAGRAPVVGRAGCGRASAIVPARSAIRASIARCPTTTAPRSQAPERQRMTLAPARRASPPTSLLQRARPLMRRRHNAQAAVVLERAAASSPARGRSSRPWARAYFNSGQHERAREAFEALLEVDPSSHYGHYALGQSLKKLGRVGEAWTHLRLAVALAPGSGVPGGAGSHPGSRASSARWARPHRGSTCPPGATSSG